MASMSNYLFYTVLCVLDLIYLTDAVCKYMKQDIAFKVVKADVVLTGIPSKVMDGDNKYFPGISAAKTFEMNAECIYKGPSMDAAVTIYGAGIFEDASGGCHNTTVKKDTETIVYLERKPNGDLLMKYVNDPGYFIDELGVCGLPKPKLVQGHENPDYLDDICPAAGEDCIRYIEPTTTKKPQTKAPTQPPTPEPEPTTAKVQPTIETNLNSVKPQVKDGGNGVSTLKSMTLIVSISTIMSYFFV